MSFLKNTLGVVEANKHFFDAAAQQTQNLMLLFPLWSQDLDTEF